MGEVDFTDMAARIGSRIARGALWDAGTCTWEVSTPDREAKVRRSLTVRAGAPVYQGSAGIAWFLGELYRVTGDVEAGRAARGGIGHALAEGGKLPPTSFGFHSGRVGIAWAAARLAETLGQPDLADAARRLLEPIAGHEHLDPGIDVIAGAGGAIPALLELAGKLERGGELVEVARRLGENLVRRAHREPGGWSWATVPASAVRYLNGFAHGASGIGLALLELARATGESRYLFAAEMAFLYERRFFDEERSNWPDLRNMEIGDFLFYHREDDLRRAVEEGTAPVYRPRFMTAWCHGSPGIGLARLRAFELTGQEVYREEAEAALRSTLESIAAERLASDNYSLCHGISGNAELPLYAAELFGDPALSEPAARAALRGCERYEAADRRWPCGTLDSASDPSLLLGEAGIGAFLLRLADPATPSVLLLRPRYPPAEMASEGFEELARQSVTESFGTVLEIFERLDPPAPELTLPHPDSVPLARTPVETAWEEIRGYVEHRERSLRDLLEDALLAERRGYELSLGIEDFTQEYLRGLARPAWEDVDTEHALFVLAPGSRLLTTRHDWQGWLATNGDGALPEEDETYHLFYLKDHRVHRRRVGPLAAVVLDAAARPASLAEVLGHVSAVFGIPSTADRQALSAKVLSQLEELYRADFVDSTHPEP